ncbi:acyl carrier protein [Archangium sp.]|uniref:acyl carrier protein n=1 Tax=Archangium sp. TaxID=1872627 RepID=UPI002D48031B|nr:acyl carrier protein [Archangium sp.]HYO52103.1 acyl carrier protein [Archangium sp.]
MAGGLFSGIARKLGFAGEEKANVIPDEAGLRAWLVQWLAKQLKVEPSQINTARRFDEYGLDSRVAVQVSGELEKIVERRLSPALLFEYPTIDELAKALAKDTAEQSDPVEA